ncbi:MAG: 1-acyl-sn-glycerol-3-phosphate acyltransferase [Methylohalobius sp.]|nr:1-acyl-sn-glycerol-3-phosphate acyltransferase [Methylohalobius sp.]
MVWPRVLVKGAAVLVWLLGGAGILIVVFPWLRRFNPAVCDAIRCLWFRGLAMILKIHVVVRGAAVEGASLVVSNHISWLDVVVLGIQAPFTFVAKIEVADWPVIGFLARASGTLFIERGSLRAALALVQAIADRLKAGERVVVFPEGTTTCGRAVLPFSGAVFQAAILSRCPVQPVAVRYLGEAAELAPFLADAMFVPHLLQVLKLDRLEAILSWSPPLPAREPREILAERARAAILNRMRTPDAEGGDQTAGAFRIALKARRTRHWSFKVRA